MTAPLAVTRAASRVAALIALAALAACAAPRVKPGAVADPASLAAQAERERTLRERPSWSLTGRLAVSDAKDGGSGTLEWRQDGDTFRFAVHAPVTGKTWVLQGDAHGATLDGLRPEAVSGHDAAALLERELGWHVPVRELTAWVRGLRASDAARIAFREDRLPAEIDEAGWTVEYRDYDLAASPPMPTKVFASRGEYRVKLSVQGWGGQD